MIKKKYTKGHYCNTPSNGTPGAMWKCSACGAEFTFRITQQTRYKKIGAWLMTKDGKRW